MKAAGNNLRRGVEVPSLKRDKKWEFKASAKNGDKVTGGDVLGTVKETDVVTQKIMVPPNISGKIKSISDGSFKVDEVIAIIDTGSGEKK